MKVFSRWRLLLLCSAAGGICWLMVAGTAWFVHPATAADRPLTVSGSHSPACSLPSDMVAYVQYGARPDGRLSQDLYVMSLDGTITRRLSKSSIVWDPSFNREGTHVICSAIRLEEPDKAGLWLISVDSGTPRCLVQYASSAAPFAPAFSPDGATIAFIRSEDDTGRRAAIWTIDPLRGLTDVHPLHQSLTLSQDGGLMWMPDSVHLRFLATETRGADERVGVWEMNIQKDKVTNVCNFDPGERVSDPALSPDGRKLAYIRRRGNAGELVLIEAEAETTQIVAQVSVPEKRIPRPFESDVTFTRDSGAIIFVSGNDLHIAEVVPGSRFSSPMYTEACSKNMAGIHNALRRYALGHAGLLPAPKAEASDPQFWVAALRGLMDDPQNLRCSCDPDKDSLTSYEIPSELFGTLVEEISRTRQIVVLERAAFHGEKRLALFSDGSVEEVDR